MPNRPLTASLGDHASLATDPAWTEVLDPADAGGDGFSFLHIENTTNVRLAGTFDGATIHFYVEAGKSREWNRFDRITGVLSLQKTAASGSGDVTSDALV